MSASENPYGIPGREPKPTPEPDHRRRILREKGFEIACVVAVIVSGVAYAMWQSGEARVTSDAPENVAEAVAIAENDGYDRRASKTVLDRDVVRLEKDLGEFDGHLDLVGTKSFEMALIWITPTDDGEGLSPGTFQDAVNGVAGLAQGLVPSAAEAHEKAVNTMVSVSDTDRPHDKGVAQTKDGWKLTYVTYRTAETSEPALVLILQRLSAASDPAIAPFNRRLYEAVHDGADLTVALDLADGGV